MRMGKALHFIVASYFIALLALGCCHLAGDPGFRIQQSSQGVMGSPEDHFAVATHHAPNPHHSTIFFVLQ